MIMEWTTTPPIKEGEYYWAYDGDVIDIVQICVSIGRGIKLIAVGLGNNDSRPLGEFTHWLGPLPFPQLPTVTP